MKFFAKFYKVLSLIIPFVRKVFPLVDSELHHWSTKGISHACPELKEQALASITNKKFHCQGGSIYSLYPTVCKTDFISLVVALQTISDYLDNLCDNAGITDEQAFRQLHYAMTDALDPSAHLKDYYAFYPYKEDGGYLKELVLTCQQKVNTLPSYELVKPNIQKLARFYSELQTYKHLNPSIREEKMLTWIHKNLEYYPQLTPWEFAAATGSTLGMFMLCAAASDKNLTSCTVSEIDSAYFPWISGLHILLDYFIDAAEDQQSGDLNFVAYYTDSSQIISRLTLFIEQAFLQASTLPNPTFHKLIVQGLLAMYLSDSKANQFKEHTIRNAFLKTAGSNTRFLYLLCKFLRFQNKL
jgi:tetraprenyl-beta-curcumene synthase